MFRWGIRRRWKFSRDLGRLEEGVLGAPGHTLWVFSALVRVELTDGLQI